MGEVNCMYCGKAIPDDVAECPHCGGVSHFQQRGYRAGAKRRFIVFVVVLTLVSLVAMVWLPRHTHWGKLFSSAPTGQSPQEQQQ